MTKRLDELNSIEEELAETVAKQPITVLEDDDAPKVRIFMALAWVHRRRTEPELSFDDYRKANRFRDAVRYIFGSDDEPEAAEGAEEAPALDPFPEGGAEEVGADAGEPADAEGPVLSGDGDDAG